MRRLTSPLLLCAAALLSLGAHAAEQTRTVPSFTSITNSGPISITVVVGGAQSVTATGSDTFLAELVTEVVDGDLRVKVKDHSVSSTLGDPKLTISVSRLTKYTMSGAGATTLSHVSGDRLEINLSGAGSLKAEGEIATLKMNLGGVGEVDTRALHAHAVNASVGGVGSVKVWASDSLDASVGGVGSLTYYGDPKVVNTTGGGLGSISRGK